MQRTVFRRRHENEVEVLPVFVGGSGRSGTTILARVLGTQQSCYAFPVELRFLTDPDGLLSLRRAIVDDWSLFHADMALHRFAKLLRHLGTDLRGRYPRSNLRRVFGAAVYDDAVREFLSSIESFSFKGAWAGRTNVLEKVLLRFSPLDKQHMGPAIHTMRFAPPFSAERFAELARTFVMTLFSAKAKATGASVLVEHTPSNVLHGEFLLEVFPTAKLIHVHRDPRDVVASFKQRDWAPSSAEQATAALEALLRRWESVRMQLPPDRYLEVKFEQFAQNPLATVESICAFLEMDARSQVDGIDLSRHNVARWKQDLSEREIAGIMKSEVLVRWMNCV